MSGAKPFDRRDFLRISSGVAAAVVVSCGKPEPKEGAATVLEASRVRLGSVPTAVEGGLIPHLLEHFHKKSKLRVDVTVGDEDIYTQARTGKFDIVISHFGHKQTEDFVTDGFGAWPRTLFSNQLALIGPASDPAGIAGLSSAVEAFRRIADTRSPFVVNGIDGVRYLTEILWHSAGRPDRTGWFHDDNKRKSEALTYAAAENGYVIWGLTPFLRYKKESSVALEPLVVGDSLFQRLMVSVVVKPSKVRGVNTEGALALENFLLAPETQAMIHDVRYPGASHAVWSPAGRNNRGGLLPKG